MVTYLSQVTPYREVCTYRLPSKYSKECDDDVSLCKLVCVVASDEHYDTLKEIWLRKSKAAIGESRESDN